MYALPLQDKVLGPLLLALKTSQLQSFYLALHAPPKKTEMPFQRFSTPTFLPGTICYTKKLEVFKDCKLRRVSQKEVPSLKKYDDCLWKEQSKMEEKEKADLSNFCQVYNFVTSKELTIAKVFLKGLKRRYKESVTKA